MNRLTKAAVREEIVELRSKINDYVAMPIDELCRTYLEHFPANRKLVENDSLSMADMLRSLIMSATYHMTNVLNVE